MLDSSRLQKTLEILFGQIGATAAQHEHRLVGTAASLLQGVAIAAGDVDILLKEREGVDAFGRALSACKCLKAPQYIEDDKQYIGIYEIQGVEVELSTVEWESDSDAQECFGRGPWLHFSNIACGSYQIPTVALELRLVSEWVRDRPDRYRPLVDFMQVNGCDAALIRRGLAAFGLAERRQAELINQFN